MKRLNLQDVMNMADEVRRSGFTPSDVALEMPDGERVRSLTFIIRGLGGYPSIVISDAAENPS